ncbi:MAG: cupredoxin domain-containing protein [Candidatus Krumholzibacteriia bacterium]
MSDRASTVRAGAEGGLRAVARVLVLGAFFFVTGAAAADKDGPATPKDTAPPSGAAAAKAVDVKPVLKDVYVIQIEDHKFIPATLVVPAKKKIKLRIENLDRTPEEFESYDLNREKVVAGGRKIIVFIGPLKPGTYKYFGEFNPKTAQGVIIAK